MPTLELYHFEPSNLSPREIWKSILSSFKEKKDRNKWQYLLKQSGTIPVSIVEILDEGKALYASKVQVERQEIDAPDCNYEYRGDWLLPLHRKSCVSYSFLNSLRVLRIAPEKYLTDVIVAQLDIEQGMSMIDFYRLLTKYPMMQLTRDMISYRQQEPQKFGKMLYDQISKKGVAIANVDYSKFYGLDEETNPHAVCITGCRASTGKMDLQIIDPAVGVVWTPVEHFLKCQLNPIVIGLKKDEYF